MDFGGLPPEITSALIYAGPGSESMLVASSAWNGLAAELRSTASSYGSVISALTDDSWLGPSAAAMEASVAPYLAWLNTAATGAEQTAAQAAAAANAYQAAFASVVPPEMIAANRIQLAQLMATNIYGQNTPAISAVEAQYGEMWAQDASAMYSYAGSSAAASRVTPFTTPPTITNPAGTANQAAATAQAAGASTGTGVQSALSQLVSTVPGSLQDLASPAATTTPTSLSSVLTNFLNSLTSTSSTGATTSLPGMDASSLISTMESDVLFFGMFMALDAIQPLMGTPISTMLTQSMTPVAAAAAPAAAAAGGAAAAAGGASSAAMGGAVGGLAGGAGGFAGLGAAASVGALSVPPSWGAAATPTWLAGMPLATPLPGMSPAGGGGLPMGIPFLPSGAGQAAGMAAAAGVGGAVASRYGPRLKVLTRSPGAGYSPVPMAPAGAYQTPAGLPPAPGYTPHIVYLPNNGTNGNNGHNGYNGNGHNGNGHNGNGHNGNH